MKYITIILSLFVFLLVITSCGNTKKFSQSIPEVEKTQFIKHSEDWRNLRYAEIIPVFKSGTKLYMEVYNSIGSNEVPQGLWDKLDAGMMAKEYGAEKVILNGPRYWVINHLEARGETENGKVVNFGGIEMTLRATLNSSIFTGAVGSKLYTENEVERETTFHYYKDNMVYELTSPTGEVYRMQSYGLMKDPNLTIERLENLGDRLTLPEGWTYNARTLKENDTMIANGIAYVINDDLGNSYQKVTKK